MIEQKIHDYYWHDDVNCATTMLKVLAGRYSIHLEEQLINAALGMHGAGKYGAQCGLVEGALMFIGIYGRCIGLDSSKIVDLCYTFAEGFEDNFNSLQCNRLRPEGFNPSNPPHLCETLTNKAILLIIEFIDNHF